MPVAIFIPVISAGSAKGIDCSHGRFSRLLLSGKLMEHLREIDTQANERFDALMDGYKRTWNITEALKAEDPMRWVSLMNNARDAAEWNIITEIIFS